MSNIFKSLLSYLGWRFRAENQQRFLGHFILTMVLLASVIQVFTSPFPMVVRANIGAAFCWIILNLGLYFGLSTRSVCLLATAFAVFELSFVAWYSGGIYSSTLAWMGVLVTANYFVFGVRVALIWLTVCISAQAMLVTSDLLMGVVPEVQGLGLQQSTNALRDNTLVFIVICLVTFFYRRSDVKVFKQLRLQQQELEVQRAELERTMAARDQLIAAVNHEVKAPLQSIAAMSDTLLADTKHPPDVCMVLEHCSAAALQVSATVADLLDYTRLQSGQLQVRPETIQLSVEMHTAYALLQAQKKSPGVRCALEIDSAFPAPLHTDKALLALCLQKLTDNACRFTFSGHITLTAHRSGNDAVLIAVEDSGIGMSTHAKDRLTQTLRSNVPELGKGHQTAGLGLLVAQGIVRLLHGSLGFESNQYQGSRFWIRLPLRSDIPTGISVPAIRPL